MLYINGDIFHLKLNKTAFTLAEVLITLLVIGIIAAMTIPALITANQNFAFRSAFKKTYSDLSAATRMIIQAQGGSLKGVCETADNDCFRDLFANYLSYVKKCDMGTNTFEGNCWVTADKITVLNGSPYGSAGEWDNDGDNSGMVLNNGVFLDFYSWNKDCLNDYCLTSDTLYMCGIVYVDLNGFKGPNITGRDILSFYVGQNGILATGGLSKDWAFNRCGPGTDGSGCAAWVLRDKDY